MLPGIYIPTFSSTKKDLQTERVISKHFDIYQMIHKLGCDAYSELKYC